MAKKVFSISVVVLLCLLIAGSSLAEKQTPAPGSVFEVLHKGLVLLKDGKYDDWMTQYCHPEDLCYNDKARESLKKYNLPAKKRLAPACLKGKQLDVVRIDGDPLTEPVTRIYLQCDPKSEPKKFYMRKYKDQWKFFKI